ncbi:hypothetical protein [Sulfuricurvum sp.]|uniref:alginate O-acetyltransferase AlgX-related protein n=1 Tax=Sulfuricurvum sp. TaxID=2025608 RepID=UPI0025EE1E0B|nr:hypothetical protein [Sulfuricurvum sp.]
MKSKKILFLFVVLNIFYISTNFFIWKFYTEDIFVGINSYKAGDLSRLGYISTSLDLRKAEYNLSFKHFESADINLTDKSQYFDLITIGDSFSNAGGGGLNGYYQDYIATLYGKKVLNIQPFDGDYLNTIVILANSGILERMKTKVVILESVERAFIERMTPQLNTDKNQTIEYIKLNFKNKYINESPEYTFLNDGNYKFILTNILRKFSDNSFNNIVYKVPLKGTFFNVSHPNDLLFYKDDIKNMKKYNVANLNQANNNLNKLAHLLNKSHIKLIVLVGPNKYTIYSDFLIQKNKYGRSEFFEDYVQLPKDYVFVNTKAILHSAVLNGEKDIYYADDTHWSYKASSLVIKSMNYLK